jgi:hypothetical protein
MSEILREGPVRKWLKERATIIPRKKIFGGSHSPVIYPGRVTNVSITVFCEDGRMTGSPWFDTAEQARAYMRRKCGEISCVPKVIKQYNWREGDTLETVKYELLPTL